MWSQCVAPYVYPIPIAGYGVPRTAYPNFFYVNRSVGQERVL